MVGKGHPDNANGFYELRIADYLPCNGPMDPQNQHFNATYGDNPAGGFGADARADTNFVKKGTWYLVTYTYDGITAKIYINGQLKNSQQKTAPFTDNTNDVFIGRSEDATYPYWFNGVIDEIRIYNRALGPKPLPTSRNQLNNYLLPNQLYVNIPVCTHQECLLY